MVSVNHVMDLYRNCFLCPKKCGVDRIAGKRGICGESDGLRIAVANLHFGEESPVTGERGSGTVFFTGCPLQCAFCQNCQISRGDIGRSVSPEVFASICIALQDGGAENINLVTGSHFIPSILHGIEIARIEGLDIPVLWNTSGYETLESLELISDIIDVWLPDLKTLNGEIADRFFKAPDYPEAAKRAIEWMVKQNSPLIEGGIISKGTILRHLVIPGHVEETREVISWYRERLHGKALLSLMFQYTPIEGDPKGPDRVVSAAEYDAVLSLLDEFKIEEGYIQERDEKSPWVPDFTRLNPFPADFSTVIWHWREGFLLPQ